MKGTCIQMVQRIDEGNYSNSHRFPASLCVLIHTEENYTARGGSWWPVMTSVPFTRVVSKWKPETGAFCMWFPKQTKQQACPPKKAPTLSEALHVEAASTIARNCLSASRILKQPGAPKPIATLRVVTNGKRTLLPASSLLFPTPG